MTSPSDIKSGDVVTIGSSNIGMTVESVKGKKADVVWFDPIGNLGRAEINVGALKKKSEDVNESASTGKQLLTEG